MSYKRFSAGAGEKADCTCPECDCGSAEDCDDPRNGCVCNGKCECNPYNNGRCS